jgi:GNAT superfamily N-acetyltransferase
VPLPTALQIETAALTAWPGLFSANDGHWVWRAARGYSNRANSIQCLDPGDGADAAVRLGRLTDLFTRHGLSPVFKVTPLTAPGALAAIDAVDWSPFGHSHVLCMQMRANTAEPRHHTALFDPRDPQWHCVQAELSGYGDYDAESVRLILERVPCDQRGVLAYDANGVPAAAVLVAVANGISIYGNVVTRASHRGQGFGRAGMNAAIAWARDAGALAAGIQVAAGNTPAIKLYSSLGFAHAYDYHYRKPQPAK